MPMSMMAGGDLNLTATVDANVTGYERGIDQAIRANQRYEASIDRVKRDMVALEKSLDDEANRALARQHSALDKTGKAWFTFGAAAALALAWATNEAIKWESAWTGVTKTTTGSAQQMNILEDQLRGLARVLPASHQEIAAVAEAAGQLGVAREDIAAFTKTAIDLGETTNLSAEDAATSLAQLMNVLQSAPDDVERLGSTLVALGNDGASTESQILAMALRLAGAGQLIGATEADVLGLASAMANLGIQAELGGGATQRVLLTMYNAVMKGGGALEGFAQVSGMSAEQFAAQWSSDPIRAFNAFLVGLGEVKDAGGNVIQTLSDVGIQGTHNLQVMLRLAGAGDELSTALDGSARAWEDNNALIIEAEKRYATTEAQIEMARNQLVDSAIDIGNVVLPALSAIVGTGADIGRAWQDLPEPLRNLFVVLGIVITAVALFGGALMIAIPKVHAFRVAVAALEAGALKTVGTRLSTLGALVTGPWGAALAVGVTALGIFAAKHGAAAAAVDALKATLDEQTGAITENSREWAIKKLSDDGMLEAARRLGLDLGMVTEAALGNQEALAAFAAEHERIKNSIAEGMEGAPYQASIRPHEDLASLGALKSTLDDTNGTLDAARTKWELENEAKEASAGGSDKAADAQKGTTQAWQDGAAAAGDLTEEVQTLGEEISDLSESYLSNREAGRAIRESLRGIKDAIAAYREEHGSLKGAFKSGTASGDEFAGMLDGLARDYMRQIEATERLTGSERAVRREYRESRAALMEVATQMLGSRDAAKKYVDEVLQIPAVVRSHFQTPGLDEGVWKSEYLERVLKRLDGFTATTYIHTVNTGNKLGGMAGAGVVQSAPDIPKADGGFAFGRNQGVARVPQIAAGGANIRWAEPETGWEAYISGKPGMESRNKAIWVEAGRRLGINDGRVVGGAAAQPPVVVVEKSSMPSRVQLVLEDGVVLNARIRGVAEGVARGLIGSTAASAEMGDRMYRGGDR